ncbi:ribonuclease E inhibitor RraB [Parasphingorhabdus sp.]|uniref:ribonuclease E inhibitor RraB n=1 Tax=Parasphingorhabdus sp. TaxID=2709688 RepID=UPI003A91C7EE
MADLNASMRVLELLEEQHDIAALKRPMRVFLYGSQQELDEIGPALEKAGWASIEPFYSLDKWTVICERQQATTEEAVVEMVSEMENIIEHTAIDFDGWETQIENKH